MWCNYRRWGSKKKNISFRYLLRAKQKYSGCIQEINLGGKGNNWYWEKEMENYLEIAIDAREELEGICTMWNHSLVFLESSHYFQD